MATPTSTQWRPRTRYQFAPWHLGVLALVVVAVVAIVWAGRMLSNASFVPRVEVVNDSEYAVDLDVASGAHDGWMGVGVAKPGATTTFQDVYDQGATWVLRFGVQGHNVEVTIPRDELRRTGWHVTVPPDLSAKVRSEGVAPTPAPANP